MSKSSDYSEALDDKYGDPYTVPLRMATRGTLEGFGRIVHNFEQEEVWIVTWPQQGWRPISPGTGNEGGVTTGDFCYKWHGDLLTSRNNAVGRDYVTGRLAKGVKPELRTHVLTREVNYHPDGGQVFYPKDGAAFVMLLAPPGDDIQLQDFVAFYFDGSFGREFGPGENSNERYDWWNGPDGGAAYTSCPTIPIIAHYMPRPPFHYTLLCYCYGRFLGHNTYTTSSHIH